MEKALADQVPFAQYFKKTFNILRFQYYRFMLLPKAERHPELCFHYKGIGLIDGYMVHKPADLSENIEIMLSLAHKRADDMRACREINPETEYYLFYIESDRDYDFETAEKKDRCSTHLRKRPDRSALTCRAFCLCTDPCRMSAQ